MKISRFLPAVLVALVLSSGHALRAALPTATTPHRSASVQRKQQDKKRSSRDDKVLKTIRTWLKMYRNRSLVPGEYRIGSKSLLKKADLEDLVGQGSGRGRGRGSGRRPGRGGGSRGGSWPYGGRGQPKGPTGVEELRFLLRAAERIESLSAAKIVLEVAAVGFDRKTKYTAEMIPPTIRRMGERSLLRMVSNEVRDYLIATAQRDAVAPGTLTAALQIAALRGLAARGNDGLDLSMFQRLLGHADSLTRLTAAECLGRIGEGQCVEWLAKAIEKETSPSTLIALVWAIRDIHNSKQSKVEIEHVQRAVTAVCAQLGSVKERPTGIALIDFLHRFRHQAAVVALIGLLERFKQDTTLLREDRLTIEVRKRANDTLRALTGAFFPMDKPEEWRAFWQTEGKKIDVAERAEKKKQASGGTVSFFGIPVRGRRVVFIIDVSGSMEWPMPQQGGRTSASRGSGSVRKIDKAKEELLKAVNGLPPKHKFNVVFYSVRAEKWRTGLVPASARNKKALARLLQGKGANGGTNLFGGLKLGLEMKSLVYGARYDSSVDEIFILSDGVPTVGEVTNMEEILRLIAETNRYSGVRINAVYLGSNSDERPRGNGGISEREGGEFMKKLAEQNGGVFSWPLTSGK